MSQHVAVVTAVDVNHLLPLHAVGREKVEIDAERLMPDLCEHVLVRIEFTINPLALDDRAGVVLDVGFDVGQSLGSEC